MRSVTKKEVFIIMITLLIIFISIYLFKEPIFQSPSGSQYNAGSYGQGNYNVQDFGNETSSPTPEDPSEEDPETNDSTEEPEQIDLTEEKTITPIESGGSLILGIPGESDPHTIEFEVVNGRIVLQVQGEDYEIEQGNFIEIDINGRKVYVGATEIGEDNAVIALSLDEDTLQKTISSSEAQTTKAFLVIPIAILVLIILGVIFLINFLRKEHKPKF
jgi:quercetin dioxygenase-like cupin family protein